MTSPTAGCVVSMTAASSTSSGSDIGRLEFLRFKLAAKLSRAASWEFWPSWAIYLPLVPYLGYLALRYRGLTTCMLANPGIPLGGLVGESKWDILRLLSSDAVVPTTLIEPASLPERIRVLESAVRDGGWTWPIILKPDVGERGTGVSLTGDMDEARAYFERYSGAVLAQAYHPGPYEAGVFYVRSPDEGAGRIFSITDKRFPAVVGDGRSSIRRLIWRHPRYRVQAKIFLRRLGGEAGRVPAEGERVQLGMIGNHCRGSMFLDGASLITPELSAAIDTIANRAPGFYFGRFDIRYTNEEAFKAGREFRIVELNGLLSESTNIYDPGMSFFRAQAILRRQWRHAYRIGHMIRKSGATPPKLAEVTAACRSRAQRSP